MKSRKNTTNLTNEKIDLHLLEGEDNFGCVKYNRELYKKILKAVKKEFSDFWILSFSMIAEMVYCYGLLTYYDKEEIIISDYLISIKNNYALSDDDEVLMRKPIFMQKIRNLSNKYINDFKPSKHSEIELKEYKIHTSSKVRYLSSDFYERPIIDLTKFFKPKDFELLRKLDIDVKNQLYTGFEFSKIHENLYDYYIDDPDMTEEDLANAKKLDGTGVTKTQYNNLLDKSNSLYEFYIANF